MGNIFGGHYTSYVKKQGVWYHINDEKVSVLKENVISPKSYCLFYRKKNS
jgi:ubiquitin C-terminal hydrolase